MKQFISFSGGVESRTLCLLYGHRAKAIFADTGDEHKVMYEKLAEFQEQIKIKHPNFEMIVVKNKEFASLTEYIKTYKFFPSITARFCTRIFKIEPIDDFLKDQGECELMIGLNYDEMDERTGNHGLLSNVTYSYPLGDLKLRRIHCIALLKEYNIEPEFPSYMSRGGCKDCPFKSKKEYTAMVYFANDEIKDVAELEAVVQDKRGKFYSIHPDIPNMKEFIKAVENQGILFKPDEMYQKEYALKTNCGVFCHR